MKDTTTKNTQNGFGLTLKSANQTDYPVLYGEDIWDVAEDGTDLAALMGKAASYSQTEINEKLAGNAGAASIIYVADLPETGDENALYIMYDEDFNRSDLYTYVDNSWSLIGSNSVSQLDNDLSYATADEVQESIDTSIEEAIKEEKAVDDGGDDVARYTLKGSWHIPTSAEFEELVYNTCKIYGTLNEVSGMYYFKPQDGCEDDVTRLGKPVYFTSFDDTDGNYSVDTDPYIFLPISGYYNGTRFVSTSGYCWTNTVSTNLANAYCYYYKSGSSNYALSFNRAYGVAVRAICDNSTSTKNAAYADLGLPSGKVWAKTNIGADAETDFGNYYAWGERDTKTTFSIDTYKYNDGGSEYTKYNSIDELTTLEYTTDTLVYKFPTTEEFDPIKELATTALQPGDVDTEIFVVCTELPTENINENKIYIVPKEDPTTSDACDEYKYITATSSWELIGQAKADLTNYLTKDEVEEKLEDKQDVIEDLDTIIEGAEKGATAIQQVFKIVTELPTEEIDPEIIYQVLKETPSTNNKYDEYHYIKDSEAWELIGGSSEGDISDLDDRVSELEAEIFPLTISYSYSNAGTYEVATSITPTATMVATRKGVDVFSSTTVTGTGITVIDNVWTGEPISSGSKTYSGITATQGGQTKTFPSLTWNFTYYRYRGVLDAVPTDYVSAIKGLSTKELSTTSTLGSTALAINKYYLFAVKGTPTLVCRHASTDSVITGCVTGTASIPQENDESLTNTYSYILVPASDVSAWNFKITNS